VLSGLSDRLTTGERRASSPGSTPRLVTSIGRCPAASAYVRGNENGCLPCVPLDHFPHPLPQNGPHENIGIDDQSFSSPPVAADTIRQRIEPMAKGFVQEDWREVALREIAARTFILNVPGTRTSLRRIKDLIYGIGMAGSLVPLRRSGAQAG
jgi:hypothetical protein